MSVSVRRRAAVTAAAALTLFAAASASAADEGALPFGQQHGSGINHLPPQVNNLEVVSKLETKGPFGDVQPEQISDVTVHNGFAYLSSWHIAREDEEQCRGGFFVVDVRDPAKPREVGFHPALAGSYHTEGMHALAAKTPKFSGDLLAISNEHEAGTSTAQCVTTPETQGGFDLWDVSDPANPKALVRGFGDMGAEEPNAINPTDTHQMSNEYHSAYLWQDGSNLFLVAVDNLEATDVDIFDITDPSKPVQIGDFDLDVRFPQITTGMGFGASSFLHDMVVKEVNGVQTMIASYWDGGYVTLNVDDPANPIYIGDSDFSGPDPLVPAVTEQSGNAHYAEFSFDNKFILAADEDFDPYRYVPEITTGPLTGTRFPAGTPDEDRADIPPNSALEGPTRYVGLACPSNEDYGQQTPPPTAPAEFTIAIVQRGVCTFQEKTETAEAAGYDGVIIFNSSSGNQGCSTILNMDFTNYQGNIPALFVARETGLKILGTYDAATYNCTPGGSTTAAPASGTKGADIQVLKFYDGWGYAHLYRNGTGKLQEVDAFAIAESLDERFFRDFGDLSIHEFATDPTEYLAYAAYYAGGMRVLAFGDNGLQQVGAYIDEGGSNFWGVEQFTGADGHRYIAGSDRDFGLYIFRYTGPGAATPPDCEDIAWYTQQNTATDVQLVCKDPNLHNKVTVNIERQPANGTVTLNGFKATYTPRAGYNGIDVFTYTAFDGAGRSKPAQVQVFVGRCARRVDGTAGRDLLNGTPAGDAMFGGGSNDTIDGVQGDDCIAGQDGSDSMSGGDGSDQLTGGVGRDRVFGDSGDDQMRGGDDRDHMRGSSGDDEVYGDAGNDYVAGGSNDDRVSGGAGNDSIRGEAGNDLLFGGAGNDSINTGEGTDKVSAGAGRDKIDAANGRRTTIRCGSGRDEVKADRTDRVSKDCERVSRLRRTRSR